MQGTIRTFKTNSQNAKVLSYLLLGNALTCLEAMQLGFTHNLRSRIADLKRAGYEILVEQVKTSTGYIAKYSIGDLL